jgi:hypothetical protein
MGKEARNRRQLIPAHPSGLYRLRHGRICDPEWDNKVCAGVVAHSSQKRLEWATQNSGSWCRELCHWSFNSSYRVRCSYI